MGKLDTVLLAALAGPRSSARRVAAATERVNLFVEFTGPVDDLLAIGFQPLAVSRDPAAGRVIASGTMVVEDLPRLEDVEHVAAAEGARPIRPLLDQSVADANITPLHGAPYDLTGTGVVVGIIDTGVDPDHRNFQNSNGTTRILALWEQSGTPPVGMGPPPGLYGVEYGEQAINSHLNGTRRLPLTKINPHGTMVAGVAAGNGSQPERCGRPYTYTGVATEADIIAVNLIGGGLTENTHVHHAFTYIWNHSRVAGRPVVINLSQGTQLGPHDGRSALEQALDADLQVARRAVVVGAGNAGEGRPHARGTVAANETTTVSFSLDDVETGALTIELWYPANDALTVHVVEPNGVPVPVTAQFALVPGGGAEARILSANGNANRDACHRIELRAHDDGSDRDETFYVRKGRWRLVVANPGQATVQFDCWSEGEYKENATFLAGPNVTADASMTLLTPGTAQHVITVGAHSHAGALAGFSSRGPARAAWSKPEIVAPGVNLTVPTFVELGGNCVRDCCVKYYARDSGTSLAAPHVAGLVALLFQRKNNLTNAQIKGILTSTAVPLDPAAVLPSNDWGYGRLDGVAALAELDRRFPPAPPGGGGRIATTAVDEQEPAPAARAAAEAGLLRTAFGAPYRDRLDDPAGARWAALVSRHFSEVRGLISHRRRVALYWHRLGGPALVRGITHEFGGNPAAPRPPAPDATRFAGYLDRFLDELERLGSAGLRREVRRHRVLLGSATPQTLLSVLAGSTPTTSTPG